MSTPSTEGRPENKQQHTPTLVSVTRLRPDSWWDVQKIQYTLVNPTVIVQNSCCQLTLPKAVRRSSRRQRSSQSARQKQGRRATAITAARRQKQSLPRPSLIKTSVLPNWIFDITNLKFWAFCAKIRAFSIQTIWKLWSLNEKDEGYGKQKAATVRQSHSIHNDKVGLCIKNFLLRSTDHFGVFVDQV